MTVGAAAGTVADWQAVCAAAGLVADGNDEAARGYFERSFVPYLVRWDGDAAGLFTGYYEPELRGAWVRSDRFGVPIYGPPADLVVVDLGRFDAALKGRRIVGRVNDGSLAPYPARAEIETGVLAGRGLELLFVDDPIDAFFLHIQGSGRVIMDDGSAVRLGFAARNGRPYFAIGRELVRRGVLARDEVSMQSIRAWLQAHPAEASAVMALNESFIFFRLVDGEAPLGAQGVALTPGRSLAVDPEIIPLGLPLWLDTIDPLDPERPLRRLVVAQDTGSAIKGAVRGDLFFGSGENAALRAGAMNRPGRYYVFLPKQLPLN